MVTDKNNTFSFTEKKRLRAYYGKHDTILNIPSLLKIQLNSYKKFLQYKTKKEERENLGLESAFNSIFPIESYTGISEIHFLDYFLGNTTFDVHECRIRGATYSLPLKIKVKLLQFHKSSVDKNKYNKEKEYKESEKIKRWKELFFHNSRCLGHDNLANGFPRLLQNVHLTERLKRPWQALPDWSLQLACINHL